MSDEKSDGNETEWKLFVGIDFGTYGSGISYTLPFNKKSYIHNMWNNNDANIKSKTTVLLTKDNSVDVVGNDAERTYFNSDKNSNKRLFKSFKMRLYNDNHKKIIRNINDEFKYVDLKDQVRATNNSDIIVSSEIVFVAELKYLKNEIFKFINMHLKNDCNLVGNVDDGFKNVQYFLTVPAIWSDKAKQQMYNWAIKSKLINGDIKDQLKIVYEPDCASLSIQHAIFKHVISNPTDIDDDLKDDTKNDANADDSLELKHLLMSINLPQYYQSFTDQGLTKITDIKELSNEDLKDYVKIVNGLHRIKIHKAIQSYNDNDDTFEELNPEIDVHAELKCGDKYILIDIGGGTCDFACHKIEDKCVISELFHPSGGDWGSINIDRMFMYYIDEIFGIKSSDIFDSNAKHSSNIAYLEFLKKFEEAKKEFGLKYEANLYDDHFMVEIPNAFVTYLLSAWDSSRSRGSGSGLNVKDVHQKLTDHLNRKNLWKAYENHSEQIKQNIKKYDVNEITLFSNIHEDRIYEGFAEIKQINKKHYISLHYNLWFLMFNEIIEPIINHCDKLLKMDELKDVKYIFLVGGFAESKYFQNYIKEYYKKYKNIKLAIPNIPGLCVVDGASKYGLYPHFVRFRRMSKHYGVQVSRKKSTVSSDILAEYIQNNTKDVDGTPYIGNLFSSIVRKNESISFDTPKTKIYNKIYENSTEIDVKIYSSIKDNPLTIDDCNLLGSLKLPISIDKKNVTVQFMFGQTILTAYVYETGNRPNQENIERVYVNYQ